MIPCFLWTMPPITRVFVCPLLNSLGMPQTVTQRRRGHPAEGLIPNVQDMWSKGETGVLAGCSALS